MKSRLAAVCVVLLILADIVAAQAPQMPKPGPEIEKLKYYVGTWKTEYVVKPGPMGPGGKMTTIDQSRLMPGGFFVETRTDGKGAMGVLKGLAIMGYDAVEKAYTYDAFNNFGEVDHFKGSVQGDTWTWNSEVKMEGKPSKLRFIAKQLSPTIYTMKLEFATDGGWTTVLEGKATKQPARKVTQTK